MYMQQKVMNGIYIKGMGVWILLAIALFSPTKTYAASTQFTADYLRALLKCEAGTYLEPNILTSLMGPPLLKHQIYGFDEEICLVDMDTPDGRTLSCSFGKYAMYELSDKYFIEGLIAFKPSKNPSIKIINAEMKWSKIKQYNCEIF